MLQSLSIRDVVLIKELSLSFDRGLSVLTGETGAGKSILLDALGLALGGRGDAGLIRKGAAAANVSAEFLLNGKHPALAFLEEHSLPVEDHLILRRTVGADGKSRAFVNDQSVSVTLLRQLGDMLVDIHGQFDNHGLLNPATHRALLDAYGAHGKVTGQVAATWTAWQNLVQAEKTVLAEAERARAEEGYLRHALAELDDLEPQVGEEQILAERRTALQAHEKLLELLQDGEKQLNSADEEIRATRRGFDRMADKAGALTAPVITALDTAYDALSDAQGALQNLGAQLSGDDMSLEAVEQRLFGLKAMARKHHVTVDELGDLRKDITQKLLLIEDQGSFLNDLARKRSAARDDYIKYAESLSALRAKTAVRMSQLVNKELVPLKLDKAKFTVNSIVADENNWAAHGMDNVQFTVATNPGQPPGALNKIASGGELARFMLALKVVLSASSPIETLIFDEVDTGIGGAVADAVGERLGKLAEGAQVLVVTHSPQVAARGTHHWQVAKAHKGKETITEIIALGKDARREEIARMLSGAEITTEARAAAKKLLAG